MKSKSVLLLAGAFLGISACSTSLEDYKDTGPTFSLQSYFNGDVTAWGIVQDFNDKTTRRFCVDIVATWEDNQGTLHETFYFADGEEQIRIWQVAIGENGLVTGTAGDVVGVASGSAQGMSFNWQYTLRVPVDDSEYDLFIDDWMFMMDDNRMMNRSYMSKLGVGVAEISIFFDKTPPIRKCPQGKSDA